MHVLRPIALFHYVAGLFILLSLIYKITTPYITFSSTPVYNNVVVAQSNQAINEAIIAGTKAGLGHVKSLQPVSGIGHFIFRGVTHLTLSVPRYLIAFKPHRPNGFIDAITLSFYWPDINSTSHNEDVLTQRERYPLTLTVLLSKQNPINHYATSSHPLNQKPLIAYPTLQRWKGYLPGYHPDTVPSQSTQNTRLPSLTTLSNQNGTLQNGIWDTQTGLIRYTLVDNASQHYTPKINTFYFKPGTNPYQAQEWIHCEEESCEYNWLRDGLWVKTLFDVQLLPQYAMIRAQIDAQLDQLITNRE